MARINLLPWRQEERLRKNKEFNVLAAAAAAFAALVVLMAMTFLGNELSNQQAANDKIKAENTRLDGVLTEIADLEKQRDDMLARMKVIQDLQGHRSVPVRVWDDIARATPKNAYLISLKREADGITLTGFAADANVVSEFMRNLDASPWLANSIVPNIKTDIQAYALPQALAAANATKGSEPRAILPEDSYISFVVTTKVVTEGLNNQDVADPSTNLTVGGPETTTNPTTAPSAPLPTAPTPPGTAAAQANQAQPAASAPADGQAVPAQPAPTNGQAAPVPAAPADAAQVQPQPVQPAPAQANTQPVGGK